MGNSDTTTTLQAFPTVGALQLNSQCHGPCHLYDLSLFIPPSLSFFILSFSLYAPVSFLVSLSFHPPSSLSVCQGRHFRALLHTCHIFFAQRAHSAQGYILLHEDSRGSTQKLWWHSVGKHGHYPCNPQPMPPPLLSVSLLHTHTHTHTGC